MVHSTNDRNSEQPWDDNLPKNKEYIQQSHKKSEHEINHQRNETGVFSNSRNSDGTQWSQDGQDAQWSEGPSIPGTQMYQGSGSGNLARIMKVKKNASGDITDIMLENGNVVSIIEAITMTKAGKIDGVNVGVAKNGREFLRSNPNGTTSDNLDSLPTF